MNSSKIEIVLLLRADGRRCIYRQRLHTVNEAPSASKRPPDKTGGANEIFARNSAPITAIKAVFAVVAKHKIVPFGNCKRVVAIF